MVKTVCFSCVLGITILSVVPSLFPTSARAANLDTFVLAVAGNSNWSTYGPPAAVQEFFGGGVGLPTNPAGLAASGITGGYRRTTAAGPTLSDTMTLATTPINDGFGPFATFGGSAGTSVQYGKVGVESHATYTGVTTSSVVAGTEAYGIFNESMSITDPAVLAQSDGFVQLAFTIDGSLSTTGFGTSDLEVNYQIDGSPVYTLMRAQVDARFNPQLGAGTGQPLPGFTVTPTSIAGKDIVGTFLMPIKFDKSFDLKFGMFAYTIPGTGSHQLDVNFRNTALLTGISVFDSNRNPLSNFTIQSGSGTAYDKDGVRLTAAVVPESGSFLLSILSLSVVAGRVIIRRRKRNG